jgi:hypothetical protein
LKQELTVDLISQKTLLEGINSILKGQTCVFTTTINKLESDVSVKNKMIEELRGDKNILSEIVKRDSFKHKNLRNKISIPVLIAATLSIGFVGYSYYETQIITNAAIHMQPNYNSNYVLQNLQGDTVDTWVSWDIANERTINIHVTNTANLPQSMIDSMENAIMSTKTVNIDDSLTGKGPKGESSVFYEGWQGAVTHAYSAPTKLFIPQKFDINGSPDGVGDIEIILTNDVNPDGYSGYTKSIVDGNEILKSKITIFKANKLDAERLGAIVRHEFGHALGLGHSTAQEDLMSPMLPDYPYISGCDIDALKGLYDGDKNSKVTCTT